MKLNHDCIRSILLFLEDFKYIVPNEEGIPSFRSVQIEQIYEAFPNHSKEDIFYSISNLGQAGFIEHSVTYLDGAVYYCSISYITFAGHQYLESIKNETIWNRIKSTLSERSLGMSFDLIQTVASSLIQSVL